MTDAIIHRTCKIDGCDKIHFGKDLCQMHYTRLVRYGDVNRQRKPKEECSVDSCCAVARSKGLCQKHYMRTRNNGSVDLIPRQPAIERYTLAHSNLDSPCHIFDGAKTANGYGVAFHSGKLMRAHRVAYEIANGPIPEGMLVLHLCKQSRACINPTHLMLGDHKLNYEHGINDGTLGGVDRVCEPRLSRVDVDLIRSMRNSGMTVQAIADELGHVHQKIDRVVRGLTYRL